MIIVEKSSRLKSKNEAVEPHSTSAGVVARLPRNVRVISRQIGKTNPMARAQFHERQELGFSTMEDKIHGGHLEHLNNEVSTKAVRNLLAKGRRLRYQR